jgi:hypothetical protein
MDSRQPKLVDNQKPLLWTWANIKYLLKWAFAGFVGTAVGLIGAGILLEIVIDWIANSNGRHGGASMIVFVGIGAAVFGYPLVGAVVTTLMGIRKLKYDLPKGDVNENNHGLKPGIVAGIAFYVLMAVGSVLISVFNP